MATLFRGDVNLFLNGSHLADIQSGDCYVYTPSAAGTYEFNAYFAGSDIYASSSDTLTVSVSSPPSGGGGGGGTRAHTPPEEEVSEENVTDENVSQPLEAAPGYQFPWWIVLVLLAFVAGYLMRGRGKQQGRRRSSSQQSRRS